MRKTTLVAALAPALLIAAPAAQAVNYPPPGNPGTVKHHPNGKHVTFRVCKTGKGRVRTIQKAIDLAAAGDTIRVCNGTYKGGVSIAGKAKAGLKLIGNVKNPRKVLIELKGSKGSAAQNGVIVNAADNVTVSGFWARHYKGNGFFAVNVTGYTFTHLVASLGGTYGIYAFKSKGGTMAYDEGYYNNDAGFYIGGTPPQTKPLRSMVKHDKAWGNVIGFSGTNVRYTTITKSDFYNNGTGITSNSATSEPYTGPAHNTVIGNRIFWNNFDFRKGATFSLKGTSTTGGAAGPDIPYPQGVGILLFGGRYNTYTQNQIFGNWLGAAGLLQQILLAGDKTQKASDRAEADVIGNRFTKNTFGKGGADLNGRDLFSDGSGYGNCAAGNIGARVVDPSDPATLPSLFGTCPFSGKNVNEGLASNPAQAELIGFAGDPPSHWLRHPHAAIAGIKPLVLCKVQATGCAGQPKG